MASFSLGFTVLVLFLAASRAPSSTWASVRAYANGAFPGIDDAVAEEIDQFVYHILPCHHSPALTLSIVKNGSLVLTKGYGFTSTNNTVNVTSRTKFAIGSLTKAFTATLIAKWLLDQSNITVDTPIKSYLPNFRVTDDLRSSRASLRDLLSHRMGLPSFFKALGMGFTDHMTRQMLVNRLAYMPTKHAFRHKLIYNNYMYALAANVLERMSAGKSWEDILKDSIFRPLNMTNSGFLEELPNFSDFALPCAMVNGSKVDLSTELFKTVLPCGPAGSIYSNAEDMAKWMNFLLRKGLGPSGDVVMRPEVIQMTQEPGMLSTLPFHELSKPFYPVSHVSQSYDMGWITANYRGHRQVFHTGGIVTHSSRLWLYPDAHVGIYVSVNGPQDKQDLLESLMYYTSDLLLNEPPWLNRTVECTFLSSFMQKRNNSTSQSSKPVVSGNTSEVSHLPEPSLYDFIGVYRHAFFGTVDISLSSPLNDSLVFKFGRFGFKNLTRLGHLDFSAKFFGPLRFQNSDDVVEIVKFSRGVGRDIDSLLLNLDDDEDFIEFKHCRLCIHNSLKENEFNSASLCGAQLILRSTLFLLFLLQMCTIL